MIVKRSYRDEGINERRINTLCLQGIMLGAFKIGNTWAVPSDAVKPSDERIKTGKYNKNKESV